MCDWQARCWIYSFFVTSFLPISSQVRFATTQSHWIWVNFNRNTSKGSNAVKRVLMTNRATCDVSNSLVWGNCFEVEIKTLRAVECGSFTLYDQRANRFLYIFSNLLAGCKKLFCVSGTSSRKPRKRKGFRRRAARASAREGVDSEACQVDQTNPCHAALLFTKCWLVVASILYRNKREVPLLTRDSIELPHLAQDHSYDFNFQEAHYLPDEVELRKGDALQMVCNYNSLSRTNVTTVGENNLVMMCTTYQQTFLFWRYFFVWQVLFCLGDTFVFGGWKATQAFLKHSGLAFVEDCLVSTRAVDMSLAAK